MAPHNLQTRLSKFISSFFAPLIKTSKSLISTYNENSISLRPPHIPSQTRTHTSNNENLPVPSLFSTVAPTHVTISGPSEARVGDRVPLQCQTAPSNPPAEIKWSVGGHQFKNATSRTIESPEGKWRICSRWMLLDVAAAEKG